MPYVKARKTLRKRKPIKRMRTKPRMSKAVSTVVKKYVRSAIKRNAETKYCEPLSANNVAISPYDSTTQLLTTVDLTNVLNLSQGTGQGARIGNEIIVTKMSLKGYINYAWDVSQAIVQAPVYVKMVIGRLRDTNTAPTSYANLFQAGSGTVAPSNLPTDMLLNFNKDSWIIYTTRVFKLGISAGTGATSNYTNNDFGLARLFKIDLSKHVSRCKWADTSTNVTNVGIYAFFLMCDADGTSITASAHPNVEIHYNVECAFKDS